MEVNQKLIDYINSEQFMLDTLLHREGKKYVYLEAIPADDKKDMFWLNGRLMNCKHLVKHVGTALEITDLIAKKLGVKKVDDEKTAKRDDGGWTTTKEYIAILDKLADAHEVIQSPRFIYKDETNI